jgi:hypothetical protein
VIPPAIHSLYFFDPNGIRLEISSDLDGDPRHGHVVNASSDRLVVEFLAVVDTSVTYRIGSKAELSAPGGGHPLCRR